MRRPFSLNRAAATLVSVVGASCGGVALPAAPTMTPAGVRFELIRPEAGSVSIAGSFNQWSPASHPLRRDGARSPWMAVVPLPPGEHLFMFVVDGAHWVSPPFAEDYVDDGFGAKNGVVVVRPAER